MPKIIPINVPMELPNVPTKIAGNILLFQPLDDASADAVAAFPILALLAIRISGKSIFCSFPNVNIVIKCIPYNIIPYNNNENEPLDVIVDIIVPDELPIAPKNNKSNNFPNFSPTYLNKL